MRVRFVTENGELPVIGDDVPVSVEVTAWPAGLTITKAWLTVKEIASDTAPVFLQVVLTAGFGYPTGKATIPMEIPRAGSLLFEAHKIYYAEVQVLDSNNKIKTVTPTFEIQFQSQLNTQTS